MRGVRSRVQDDTSSVKSSDEDGTKRRYHEHTPGWITFIPGERRMTLLERAHKKLSLTVSNQASKVHSESKLSTNWRKKLRLDSNFWLLNARYRVVA